MTFKIPKRLDRNNYKDVSVEDLQRQLSYDLAVFIGVIIPIFTNDGRLMVSVHRTEYTPEETLLEADSVLGIVDLFNSMIDSMGIRKCIYYRPAYEENGKVYMWVYVPDSISPKGCKRERRHFDKLAVY